MDGKFTRREFIQASGRMAALGGLASLGLSSLKPARTSAASAIDQPLVWVWKFSADGDLGQIRDTLAGNGLGIILKTHDGDEWMTRFDHTADAVTGPAQVERLAHTFEGAGIPFHAWCVVQGLDPIAEARMCAAVLDAGARSLYLDLEPKEGKNYWQGPWEAALTFGWELRRLRPDAYVTVAPDARPWQVGAVPLHEFASFSNGIAPQSYWATFNGPSNYRRLAEHGYHVGPEGVTPELIVEVGQGTFRHFGLPIQPIGQGASTPDLWQRFLTSTSASNMTPVSVWRYGSADPAVFGVLGEMVRRAREQEAAPQVQAAPEPAPQQPAESVEALSATTPAATDDVNVAGQKRESPIDAFQSRREKQSWSHLLDGDEDRFPNLKRLLRRFGR